MDHNLEIVTESNIERFLDRLYVESDQAQRDLYRNLLLSEFKRYSSKEEQLKALERSLRRCDTEIVRQRTQISYRRAEGIDARLSETRLDNTLDLQAALRIELRKALNET